MLVFSNALVISLAALVPGVSLGWWAIASGTVVLAFVVATGRSAMAEIRRRSNHLGWVWLVLGLLAIAGWEFYAGIRLVVAFDSGAVEALSYVVIADLMFGIARAWQLIGLRDTGLLTSLRALVGPQDPPTQIDGERP
jgi:hypothetical protein